MFDPADALWFDCLNNVNVTNYEYRRFLTFCQPILSVTCSHLIPYILLSTFYSRTPSLYVLPLGREAIEQVAGTV